MKMLEINNQNVQVLISMIVFRDTSLENRIK
jgi:hypothetical protein